MDRKGVFICFEGVDGSGKSVVIEAIFQWFKANYRQREFVQTREPGGSRVAEKIRNIILDQQNQMDPWTELLLYFASRTMHLNDTIIPALRAGKVVLCDRYVHSTLAYQGYARGIGIDKIYDLSELLIKDYFPNLVIFLDIQPSETLGRISHRNNVDRLELEGMGFQQKVYDGYLESFKNRKNFSKIEKINAKKDLNAVIERAKELIINFLENKK